MGTGHLGVVSNFSHGNRGAGEIHACARNFEERDLREALVLAEGDFRARTCVSPESRKLELLAL